MGGGVPPNSAKSFWAECFFVKGGRGVPRNSAKGNSAKKQVFKVQKLHLFALFKYLFSPFCMTFLIYS